MKKLFPEKKMSKKSLLEFFDSKGFYIVLILCIAIVGTTAVFLTTRNINSSSYDLDPEKIISDDFEDYEDFDTLDDIDMVASGDENIMAESSTSSLLADSNMPAEDSAVENAPDSNTVAENTEKEPVVQAAVSQQKPKEEEKSDKAETEANKQVAEKSSDSKDSSKSDTKQFTMPVTGDITVEFSVNKLVYSRTLEEWRTHSGIDIASDRGTGVKVVADGVVSDIKNDPRYGITVIVDHGSGLTTVYANLASDDMVVPNQKVKQGDVIGSVGNTAAFELTEEAHLHFEVLKNNKPVDPKEYLPVK